MTGDASSDGSDYAGLRHLVSEKQSWAKTLRWVLIISFVTQFAFLGIYAVCNGLDEWTARGVLLQFTAMFIAALRYLFR